VINPITLVQTGDIHLQFTAIDFGYVTPTAMSDALSPSGLQSNVIFIANDNTTGIARVVANAVFPYPTNVMGTDTVEILVASQ
jgi:hypothetical protein